MRFAGDFFRLSLCSTMLSLIVECNECTANTLPAACGSGCLGSRRFRGVCGPRRTPGREMAAPRLDSSAGGYLGSDCRILRLGVPFDTARELAPKEGRASRLPLRFYRALHPPGALRRGA